MRRRRQLWMRSIFTQRQQQGEFHIKSTGDVSFSSSMGLDLEICRQPHATARMSGTGSLDSSRCQIDISGCLS